MSPEDGHSDHDNLDLHFVDSFGGREKIETIRPVITADELREQVEGNEELENLLDRMLETTRRYAHDVAAMSESQASGRYDGPDGRGFREEDDDARTRLHNALMTDINVLSRNLAKEGYDISWMQTLVNGTSFDDKRDRAAYGKFALLLTYERALKTLNEQEEETDD